MPIEELAGGVAMGAGATLILSVAIRHLLGRPRSLGGLALALMGVLLIGFPLLERSELGLDADGRRQSGDLRARIDIAAAEAMILARLDDVDDRLAALSAAVDLQPIVAPPPLDGPAGEGGESSGQDPGASDPSADAVLPAILAGPDPRPGAGLLALVFHRSDRAGDARRLVQALRDLGFAAASVSTDLSEAASAPAGASRVLWQGLGHAAPEISSRRHAAQAAAEAVSDVVPGEVRLDDAPREFYRGDVQIQLF